MGVEPPFIYDKPSVYAFNGPTTRGFNPRAATQASWTPPAPRPKRDGPLVDFNKHPDSYLIVPYGNLNVEPMNPKTKARVKHCRRAQLALRILSLIGALGLMFCIISINNTSGSVGWIIRVGPAVVLCHCVYAIYHLGRDATGRPPASTASYMLFAGMIDTGLIPFFVFSAIMANADYSMNLYGWGTLFNNTTISYKIIHAFYLACLAETALLICSLALDVYLAITFRKIAKMPPDMNPLEPDNLTARPSGRHKRNKSEMTFEKHLSNSTLATQRLSHMSQTSLMGTKRVPFTHTRTDSADRITLYGNEKAFDSRVSLRNDINAANNDPYRSSAASERSSLSPSRPTSAMTPAANSRSPGAGLDHKPTRSSGLANNSANGRPNSWLSYTDRAGTPTEISSVANQQLDEEVRPLSPVSMMSAKDLSPRRSQEERQNWYQGSARQSQAHLPLNRNLTSFDDHEHQMSINPPYAMSTKKRSRDPLGMNPPTPLRVDTFEEHPGSWNQLLDDHPRTPTTERSALADVNPNLSRPDMGSRPSSFIGSGGKARYYGNLRDSLGGSPTRSLQNPNVEVGDSEDEDNDEYGRTRTMQSAESENFRIYGIDEADMPSLDQHTHSIMVGRPQEDERWSDTRKVSNSTGYDLKSGYAGLGSEFGLGMARRREVSGKVAEEGRVAGYGGIGMPEEKVGAVVTGQAQRGGAAGWARFKGL